MGLKSWITTGQPTFLLEVLPYDFIIHDAFMNTYNGLSHF